MKRIALAVFVAAFATAAFAQTTTTTSDGYYVVQDVKTKKCTIMDKKPETTTSITILGDGAVFKTRTEADTGMQKIKVCTTN
jgi:hypothetical protein